MTEHDPLGESHIPSWAAVLQATAQRIEMTATEVKQDLRLFQSEVRTELANLRDRMTRTETYLKVAFVIIGALTAAALPTAIEWISK